MHKAEKKFSNIHGISSLLAVWKYTNCSLFGARAHYPHRSLGYIVIAAILVFLIYARLCVCSYAPTKEEERITQTWKHPTKLCTQRRIDLHTHVCTVHRAVGTFTYIYIWIHTRASNSVLVSYRGRSPYKEILRVLFPYGKTADIAIYALTYILIRYAASIKAEGEKEGEREREEPK